MSSEPRIDPSVYVHPTAQIYGSVAIGPESSVWPNVVIRAEAQSVRVGRYTNLQDFVMIHIGYGHATEIITKSWRLRTTPRCTDAASKMIV